MEEVYDESSMMNLYGLSFDSFLKLALELDILKMKDQNQFLPPLNIDKQYVDMINCIPVKEKAWAARLTAVG